MVNFQPSLSMGFSRQEYWNGLPFPTPGDLPGSVIKLMSSALAGIFFTTAPLRRYPNIDIKDSILIRGILFGVLMGDT